MTNVLKGDRVHFCGNSITAFGWYSASSGMVDQINARWSSQSALPLPATPGPVVATQGIGSVPATVRQPAPVAPAITVTASGVVGNRVADIAADISGRILNFTPTLLFLEVVTNDIGLSTTQPSFQASYTTVLDAVIAAIPAIRIVCLGILCYNENWVDNGASPPTWPGGNNNARLESTISDLCAARSANCTYVNLQGPCLAYYQVHNAPAPGAASGILTIGGDGVHPNPTGQVFMANNIMPYLNVVL